MLKELEKWFINCPSAVIAYSGGVDSALTAFLARKFLGKENCLAVISGSESLKRSDLTTARVFCNDQDILFKEIITREIENPNYSSNPSNRCFFCKQTLYSALREIAQPREAWILNGTNTDDLGDYRPGLDAARDAAVRSPLAECGIDKATVRKLAREFNLACAEKPASPCLSSRIPYGQAVTSEKLRQIEQAEAWLNEAGFPIVRVRHDGQRARIEVPPDRLSELMGLRDKLVTPFQSFGFLNVEIDLEGFVSGKLNRALKL